MKTIFVLIIKRRIIIQWVTAREQTSESFGELNATVLYSKISSHPLTVDVINEYRLSQIWDPNILNTERWDSLQQKGK